MIEILTLIAGLVLLVLGGDILVRGSVSIAEKLLVPPLIIGLTIVSVGTSAPELLISVQAALAGSGGLAIGNVVGSNIANVLLVLGLPALIRATCCREDGIGRNIYIMIGITIVFMAMLAKGSMGMLDGGILLAILALFLWDQYNAVREVGFNDYHDEVPDIPVNPWISVALLVGGMVLLPVGASLTVDSAQSIAGSLGVPDEVIGLTIVAIGTSLPELAASMMAVLRGNSNVALGNVVGSNVFNIAAIMGITSIITPIEVGRHIISFDMWIMLGVSLFLAWLAWHKGRISRRSGVIMTSAYTVYMIAAFVLK